MKPTESPESIPESTPGAAAEGAESAEAEAEAGPEPWTPERVSEWNAYYDVYVVLGVLLLAFLVSANRISHSAIWTQLQVGKQIAAEGSPVVEDRFSYTEAGKRWVNIPWLFELTHALAHRAAYDLAPSIPNEEAASAARADQVAAGALVAVNALARMLTALALLSIRRAGPGRWWSAVCVILALGAVVSPAGVLLGGVAGPAVVSPATWGLLLLAVEVWLLHRATDMGRGGSVWALVPLFALWANLDESFLVGLIYLAAAAVGRVRPSPAEGPGAVRLPAALAAFGACAAACLVNPAVFGVYAAAADPFLGLFRPATDVITPEQLSYFGPGIRQPNQAGAAWPILLAYYLTVVGLGAASFVLNRKRFSLTRFLVFAAAAVLWGVLKKYSPEFSVALAASLALNGQEWYLDRFGHEGRVGTGWSLWSVGGRAATILLTFLCVSKVLLGALPVPGFAATEVDSRFGFGYDRDDFPFEAADFLKTAGFRGNVLNTNKSEGDALVWRAYPTRKVYIDNRKHLYPAETFNRLQDIRRALADDDAGKWKPMLDEHSITAVMVPPAASPRTYETLSRSKGWVPFYDDGAVVVFGRADAPAADLAFFHANRLDPDAVAYRRPKSIPFADRPPTAVTWIDNVFRGKELTRPQPHTQAARHWLDVAPPATEGAVSIPDPARCLLAIREARTALASKPDDPEAFRLLALAYRELMTQEAGLLSGLTLPDDNAQLARLAPRPNLIPVRYRQLVAALNYAIQTTPPPRSAEARHELQRLNVWLFQTFLAGNAGDLARDRLKAVLDSAAPGDFDPETRARLGADLAQLDARVKQVEEQMSTLTTEQQVGPVQLAAYAMNQGAPGLALRELEEAERTGTNPALVKPQLLDLYCETGQPDKAVEMLSSGTIEDPSFGTEPGVSAMRQARVYGLLGNYSYADTLWKTYAIPRVRYDRAVRSLSSTQAFLKGDVQTAARLFLEIPAKVAEQGNWEFEAGLCALEGANPEDAAAHLAKSLELTPRLAARPIVAYYLEKLGKPVPPIPADESDKDAVTAAGDESDSAAAPAAKAGDEPAK